MPMIIDIIKKWLPLTVMTAGLGVLVYAAVQQSLRQGANDPQIQMAEDAAARLNSGASPEAVVPAGSVEIATSLAPFLVVFDDSGRVLASSATLHGAPLSYPSGVLDYARQNSEDRVTWQPEPGVRMATVVVRFNHGLVMAGRSLREVEIRENGVEMLSAAAVVAIWFTTLVLVVFGEVLTRRKA